MADQSHKIVCYDIDTEKLDGILEKKAPILEPGLTQLIEKNVESRNLAVNKNPTQAILGTDITFIAVGTPSADDGSINLDHILAACRTVAQGLKEKTQYHTVVIRSTILPGTSEKYLIPALEKLSGKIACADFGYIVNPEFLREGSAIDDYLNPPKIVIGTDGSDPEILETICGETRCPKVITSVKNAEAIKYVDNSWHALKVGFANEIGNILKEQNIDSHEVMNIFALDTKLNISSAYLKPGFSFGGSCLPKDVQAISNHARHSGLKTPILSSLIQANDDQILRAVDMIDRYGRNKILLLGLTFKANTSDLRNSPLLKLAEILLEKKYDLTIFDPNVSDQFKKSSILANCLIDNAEEYIKAAEVVVIGNNCDLFANIAENISVGCQILDLARLNNPMIRSQENYAGICW